MTKMLPSALTCQTTPADSKLSAKQYAIAVLIAFGASYDSRPNGSASEN
jgi:hypothetical protein